MDSESQCLAYEEIKLNINYIYPEERNVGLIKCCVFNSVEYIIERYLF